MSIPNRFDEFDPFEERDEHRPEACLVCEALCPDAVDGTLSEGERKAFEKHVAGCAHCAQELEEAQRGAAWLGLLKSRAPEPPASLLARILAETTGAAEVSDIAMPAERAMSLANAAQVTASGAAADSAMGAAPGTHAVEAFPPPGSSPTGPPPGAHQGLRIVHKGFQREVIAPAAFPSWQNKVLSFGRNLRRAGSFGGEGGGPALHPRLAMTAAMAFFSIALTLNLTGVQLRDFDAEKLQPRALQRTAAAAEASAVRSFQNLKVVYQVESRVSELRQDPLWDTPADSNKTGAPAKKPDEEKATRDRGQD